MLLKAAFYASHGDINTFILLYLQKHKINKKANTFTIIVKEKPKKAGIDPINKLIDRHSDDNTKTANLAERGV